MTKIQRNLEAQPITGQGGHKSHPFGALARYGLGLSDQPRTTSVDALSRQEHSIDRQLRVSRSPCTRASHGSKEMAALLALKRSRPRFPASGRSLPTRLIALIVVFVAGTATFVSGVGTAQADTGEGRISHCYVNMSAPWENPGRISTDWGTFLQSIRAAAGHWFEQDTNITQNANAIPNALLRADLNVTNAAGHQAELRLWFTPNNLYLRGFTTTSVDANDPANGNVTYYFDDPHFNLENEMNYLRPFSQDSGLLPPANYVRLPYSGSYAAMARAPAQGGPGVTRDNTQMSYSALWDAVFRLAYLPRNTAQNGGDNFQSTARSLLRMIQVTAEAARLRDVQGIVIQMMANHSFQYTMPLLQQELENDWGSLSQYAYDGVDVPGHYVGPHVDYVQTIARALGYLAIMLAPGQGSGP